MKQRILTGSAMVALLILVLFAREYSVYVFDIFWLAIAVVGAYEMSELLRKMNLYNNKWFIMLYPLFSYALYLICFTKNVELYLMFILQVSFLVLYICIYAIICLFSKRRVENEIKTRHLMLSVEKFSINKSIHTLFGLLYPTVFMLFFILINRFGSFNLASIHEYEIQISRFILIFAFVIPVFTDTFALFTGMIFKGKKLCPRISPNKTISGAIGGAIWGTISSICLFLIFNAIHDYSLIFETLGITLWKVCIIGFVISVLSQLGDLFESYLKRKAQVKDSGNILPGHGGILDRLDSHLVSGMIAFISFMIMFI